MRSVKVKTTLFAKLFLHSLIRPCYGAGATPSGVSAAKSPREAGDEGKTMSYEGQVPVMAVPDAVQAMLERFAERVETVSVDYSSNNMLVSYRIDLAPAGASPKKQGGRDASFLTAR